MGPLHPMIPLILSIILAYLAGSINFSILLFKISGKKDPRKEFSGNPGVVNVYRQAGLLMAALVWLLDMGRAIGIALACIYLLSTALVPIGGLALILGTRFPCFHQFRGGQGRSKLSRIYNDHRAACCRNFDPGLVGDLCNFSHPFCWIFCNGFYPGRRNTAGLQF